MKLLKLTSTANTAMMELKAKPGSADQVAAINLVLDALESDGSPSDVHTESYDADPEIVYVMRSRVDGTNAPTWIYWREGPESTERTILDIFPT